LKEARSMLSYVKDWRSRVKTRSRREIVLLVAGGIVVIAGAAWGIFTYGNRARPAELLTYRLCIGSQQERCPKDATFVRDAGEETVPRWAQSQCASYKRRRIIISDAPSECACQIADVTCATE
jgi:hypothetical protein